MLFGFLKVTEFVAYIIAIVLGIVIIVKPRIVAYLVGAYLIIIGVLFFVQRYF